MFSSHRARRRFGFLGPVIAIALVAVACGGSTATVAPSATPTPTATPTAAPTPSPTPVDVPAAFVKSIVSPTFSATAVITGDLAIGPVEGDISGSGAFSGPNSKMSLTITAGTFKQETETVKVASTSWSREAPGPWLEDPAKPAGSKDSSLGEMLRSVVSVVDLGVEARAGKQLHHLRSSSGNAIPGDAVGFGSDSTKNPKFTLDFYATDDGTPAIMAIAGTWTQMSGAVEVASSMSFDIAFSDIGEPQVIEPPDDVWVHYTSAALGYTMAHPADWTVEPSKDKDTYLVNSQPYIYVAVTPFKGSTAKFVTALKASYKEPFGGDPASEAATTLGGEAAVRLTYAYKNDAGQDVTLVDDALSRDGSGWEVFLVTGGGPEDVEIFDTFIATFAFVD